MHELPQTAARFPVPAHDEQGLALLMEGSAPVPAIRMDRKRRWGCLLLMLVSTVWPSRVPKHHVIKHVLGFMQSLVKTTLPAAKTCFQGAGRVEGFAGLQSCIQISNGFMQPSKICQGLGLEKE